MNSNPYIHKLFLPTDTKGALDYLADAQDKVKIIKAVDAVSGLPFEGSEYKRVIKNILYRMCGKNVVTLANYSIVEDSFFDIYYDHFLSISRLCDINCSINVYHEPGPIITFAYLNAVRKGYKVSAYNPQDDWKQAIMKSHTYPNFDINNPLMYFTEVVLQMDHVQNFKFLTEASKYSIEYNTYDGRLDKVLEELSKRNSASISFRLLPNSDYYIIQHAMTLLHKYF